MSTIDQQFVEYIVTSLVGNPDSVQVHPDDLGRVIGKRGVTAQSLRTLLRALGTKNDARYNLKIVNNDTPQGEQTELRGDTVDTTTPDTVENQSSFAENARKELAELDDLDI